MFLILAYWQNVLVACHYYRFCQSYIIFTLPLVFSDYFWATTAIMDTCFNQPGYHLNDLVPMLFAKTRELAIKFELNDKLSSSFAHLLKQGTYRGKILVCFHNKSICQN